MITLQLYSSSELASTNYFYWFFSFTIISRWERSRVFLGSFVGDEYPPSNQLTQICMSRWMSLASIKWYFVHLPFSLEVIVGLSFVLFLLMIQRSLSEDRQTTPKWRKSFITVVVFVVSSLRWRHTTSSSLFWLSCWCDAAGGEKKIFSQLPAFSCSVFYCYDAKAWSKGKLTHRWRKDKRCVISMGGWTWHFFKPFFSLLGGDFSFRFFVLRVALSLLQTIMTFFFTSLSRQCFDGCCEGQSSHHRNFRSLKGRFALHFWLEIKRDQLGVDRKTGT